MEKHYSEKLKIKIDKENNTGTLSIKASENKVEVFKFNLSELKSFITKAYNEVNK